MKLKKFFAGVLAAAMMLTVGATAAFATNTTESMIVADGNGVANFTLTKKLMVAEGTAPQKMTFDFTVSGHVADADKGAKAGTVGGEFTTQPSVTFEKTGNEQFTVNTYSQDFSIDLVKLLGDNYNKVGKYAYTISENETKIPGITKDAHTYEMIVTVVNKQKNNLTNETGYGYYVGMYDAEGQKVPAVFTNTYNSYSLEVKKTVEGNFGDLGDTFTFYITLGKEDGKDDNYATATVHVSDTSNPANNATWTVGGGQQTVTLKHGQTITVSNLPVGVTYTVTEEKTNADGSTWVYNTTGEAVAINDVLPSITADNNANKVEIVNKHEGTPDMGVVLDNAPYIAMLAIVAIGGVALMLNKRRRDEE
jgi:pilin isopeptide linkage protein